MYQSPDDPNYVILQTDNGMNFRIHGSCITPTVQVKEEENTNQVFKGAVDFPIQLADQVFGPKKSNVNELRKITGAKISISEGLVNLTFVITANSQAKLDEALAIVRGHVEGIILSQPYTHIVCIPCVDDPVFSQAARDYVGRINGMCALSNDAIDNLYRLHVNLCTLRLLNDDQVTHAGEVLKRSVASFDWTYKNHAEISGINTSGSDRDGPKQFVAQFRGTDELLNMKELQQALVDDFKKAGIDVVDIPENLFISLVKRSWVKGQNWGGPAMVEMSFNTQLPPAPISSVALCKRYVWRPQNFFFTNISCKLGPAGETQQEEQQPYNEDD